MTRCLSAGMLIGSILLASAASAAPPFFPKTHPREATLPARAPTPGNSGLSSLVGTWKQLGQESLLWSIRADGQFRVHGVFLGQPYRGKLVSRGNGQYDVVTTAFTDQISARVEGDRLLTDGRLGAATWLPVWRRGGPAAAGGGDGGACTMIPSEAVAAALTATIVAPKGKAMKGKKGQPRFAVEGCNYVSNLTRNDRVELILVGGAFTFNQASQAPDKKLALPGVAHRAFAKLRNGILTAHVLLGQNHLRIKLRLVPGAAEEDLTVLAELVNLAVARFRPEWA